MSRDSGVLIAKAAFAALRFSGFWSFSMFGNVDQILGYIRIQDAYYIYTPQIQLMLARSTVGFSEDAP